MVWDGEVSVHDRWGTAPTLIQPLVVRLTLSIQADSIHVFPLNECGKEDQHFTLVAGSDGRFDLVIDQEVFGTPWFGIKAFAKSTSHDEVEDQLSFSLHPNPQIRMYSCHSLMNQVAR